MSRFVYLDNAATTSTRKEVVDAMLPYFTENFGNPSSVYDFAAKNKKAVDDSRQTIADALNADIRDIYFTAGGSEADNWALIAAAEAYEEKGKHIITSKIEHHAILHTCDYLEKRGFEITYIDVDENGVLKLDQLKKAIRPDTILISIMSDSLQGSPCSVTSAQLTGERSPSKARRMSPTEIWSLDAARE